MKKHRTRIFQTHQKFIFNTQSVNAKGCAGNLKGIYKKKYAKIPIIFFFMEKSENVAHLH